MLDSHVAAMLLTHSWDQNQNPNLNQLCMLPFDQFEVPNSKILFHIQSRLLHLNKNYVRAQFKVVGQLARTVQEAFQIDSGSMALSANEQATQNASANHSAAYKNQFEALSQVIIGWLESGDRPD